MPFVQEAGTLDEGLWEDSGECRNFRKGGQSKLKRELIGRLLKLGRLRESPRWGR